MNETLARALRWGKNQFSLDPQPEQDLLSAETGADVALGMIPGVGQAMALRDMERARRAEDPVQGGLAAASLLPFGKLAGALKNKIIAGKGAKNAPLEEMAAGEAALTAGKKPEQVWQDLGVFKGTENHAPTKWEIPDQKARFQEGAKGWAKDDLGEAYQGRLGDMLQHDKLYANYPHIADTQVFAHMGPDNLAEGGYYAGRKGQPAVIDITGKSRNDLISTLLHEIQHGVQAHEGFDSGSNYNAIKDALMQTGKVSPSAAQTRAFNTYRNNMGEAEARAVEQRFGQSEGMNWGSMPTESYDVPMKDLVSEDQISAIIKKLRSVGM